MSKKPKELTKRQRAIYEVISANPNASPAELRKALGERGHRITMMQMSQYQDAYRRMKREQRETAEARLEGFRRLILGPDR